jgi:hypothetical protein
MISKVAAPEDKSRQDKVRAVSPVRTIAKPESIFITYAKEADQSP